MEETRQQVLQEAAGRDSATPVPGDLRGDEERETSECGSRCWSLLMLCKSSRYRAGLSV